MNGQGITRARNYLVKVLIIDLPFLSSDWAEIKKIADLKNAIAHRDGFVDYEPADAKSMYSRMSAITHIQLKQETANQEDAQIIFGPELILSVLRTFDRFTHVLASELGRG